MAKLKLADLKPGTEHPMENRLSDGRCLMHVKLTDLCMKSVEGLINSEKVRRSCSLIRHRSRS